MFIRLIAFSGTLFVTVVLFSLYSASLFFAVQPTTMQPVTIQSAAAADAPPAKRQADEAAIAFFEKRVRPILAANCYECHGDDEQEAGLSVASIDAMLRGGDQGAAIVPGGRRCEARAVGIGRPAGHAIRAGRPVYGRSGLGRGGAEPATGAHEGGGQSDGA